MRERERESDLLIMNGKNKILIATLTHLQELNFIIRFVI